MGQDGVIDILNQAIRIGLMISAPMLLGALFMGIVISLFQAVTQINEQTLSFIPKIIVIFGILILCAPWISQTMTSFTQDLFLSIPKFVKEW
jgi:flagellar biosynthetic protein FliQ